MSRQPRREANEPINELIHRALTLLEQFKTKHTYEDRNAIHETVKSSSLTQIPQHPGYVEFVNKNGVFYQSYLQMCASSKHNETAVLESRFQNSRRNSHGSVSARGSLKAVDASRNMQIHQESAKYSENNQKAANNPASSSAIDEFSSVNPINPSSSTSSSASSPSKRPSPYPESPGRTPTVSAASWKMPEPANHADRRSSNGTVNGSMKKTADNSVNGNAISPASGKPMNGHSAGHSNLSEGHPKTHGLSKIDDHPKMDGIGGYINDQSGSTASLPGNFAISPSILINKIRVSKVSVVDFRPFQMFSEAHISCPLIVNLDPETSSHFSTVEQIQDSLIVSPGGGFDEFCQRSEVDLICVYDEYSKSENENPHLEYSFHTFRESGFQPYSLRGGFDAWQYQYPNEVVPPPLTSSYSRFGSSSSLSSGASSAKTQEYPVFKSEPVLVKQSSPPLPRAPPPPIPPVPPAHKHLAPKLPPKEELTVQEKKQTSPSLPHRAYTAPVLSPRQPHSPPASSNPHRSSQLYADLDQDNLFPHADSDDSTYPYQNGGKLDMPEIPARLPPPVPKPESPRVPTAVPASLVRTRSSSTRHPAINGYSDAPAKSSLPSLRVPKLSSNSQRNGLSPSPSPSASKRPYSISDFSSLNGAAAAASAALASDSHAVDLKRSSSMSVRLPSPSRQATPPYVDEDVPPHSSSNTGLRNLGNTCYMNCIIQCLTAFPKSVERFYDGSFINYVNYKSKLGHRGEVAQTFAELVRAIFQSNNIHAPGAVVAPVAMKGMAGHLRPDDFAGFEQQDCQDFLTFLLDGLHEDLNLNGDKPKQGESNEYEEKIREQMGIRAASAVEWERYLEGDTSLIVDSFQGQYLSRLQCLTCKHTSTTYNAFSSLSSPIVSPKLLGQHTTLKSCFDEFVKPEILVGDNAWYCPNCKAKRRTVKTSQISRLPPILVIHLKRFKRTSSGVNKLETPVDYPVRGLDLTRYWPQSRQQDLSAKEAEILSKIPTRGQQEPFIYDSRAVTLHRGTLKGGHYTAVVQKPGIGWLYYDDANVYPVKEQAAVSRNAYVLFYRRRM